MAFLGYSDDFDLDDDGILRDSASSGGILIDDDGIVRDDYDNQSKYTSRSSTTHWTDSGLGGDKQSGGSSSTLRQFDFQSYPSYDNFEDSHVNISDLEASKDDLSFEGDAFRNSFDRDTGYDNGRAPSSPGVNSSGLQSGLSSRSSFDHSLAFDDTNDQFKSTTDSGTKELFDSDYYKQLEELGVLIDGAELNEPLASLDEFEVLEDHVSREDIQYSPELNNSLDDFLRKTPGRSLASPGIGGFNKDKGDNREEYDPPEERQTHTRPNTASSARTISSRSFPEISPEEALEYYNERVNQRDSDQDLDLDIDDAESIDFEESQRTGDDDEIFIITSRISDEPKPAKIRAYGDERDAPSMVSPSVNNRSAGRHSRDGSRSNTPHDKKGHLVRGLNSRGSDRSIDNNDSFMSNHSDGLQDRKDRLPRQPSSRGDRSYDHNDSFLSNHSYTSRTSRDGSLTPVSAGVFSESHHDGRPGSLTPRNTSQSEITRPDSAASQRSAASENVSARSKTRSSLNNSREDNAPLSKARSQESFFRDTELQPVRPIEKSTPDKMPKRLLPKPNAAEVSQSYRVKSKSTTNIAAKVGPIKPKHMSVSDLSRIQLEEHESEAPSSASDKSKNELSSKLNQEFHKRKQATELVQQLQKDYDRLLSKYASAELTIDQLRLGARVTLHSSSPTPSQATTGSIQSLQQPQLSQLNLGVKSPSPFQGSLGYASPLSVDSATAESYNDHGLGKAKFRSQSESALTNGNAEREARNMALSSENGAESVKIGLMFQANGLDDRMESFKTLLDERQLTHDEQEKVFEKIRTDHEKLRRDYLQSKEDYNVLKRANASVGDVNFDQEKELEGELFRIGMKFDEIHEKVDENRQKKSSERQPFQGNRVHANGDVSMDGSEVEGQAIDQKKKKMTSTKAGDDLIKPRNTTEFEDTVKLLHDEYNNLMDRYRRLKQMAQTPERDREIDNLVRKLKYICNSEPEIFRMPKELQESQVLQISFPSDVSQTGSDLDDETPSLRGKKKWEQLQERDEDGRRQSVSSPSLGRRPSDQDMMRDRMASVQNQSFTRGRDTPTKSHNWSMDRSYSDADGLPGDNNLGPSDSISSSRSSLSSRGHFLDNDRSSPNPRLPRPHRHDHPDRKRGLKKRPEGGSLSSLGDSGISEHDNTNGGGATAGNLSSLPGPGKFKQMTKQRNAPDADSGFIGSMVGSEVSQQSSRQQQQQDQAQPSLRLRHPSDQERPKSRSRDAETASVSSSRSGRSGRSRPDERPSSRGSLRSGGRRDMTTDMSQDFTDDSYTLTESDASFDSSQHSRRRQRPRNAVEASIQEEDEARPPSTPRQQQKQQGQKSRVEPHQPIIRTPTAKTKANFSRSSLNTSGHDLTPRSTSNVSFNDSQDVFLSGDDTPRQVTPRVARTEAKIEAQKSATVTRQQLQRRPQTPPVASVERPLTPGTKTREVIEGRQGGMMTQERSRPKEEMKPKVMEDRSVGSDSDDTLEGSEAPTVGTKVSEGSEKFRLLQDEIGRLRDEFKKATEQQQQQMLQQQQQIPLPPPTQPQPPQEDRDYYFDPTEDAYAFMRGPRRRANSFSGAGIRDWDDWWKYPLNNPNDGADIPLGYAAADSYATPSRQAAAVVAAASVPTVTTANPETQPRGRHRIRRKYRKSTSENAAQTQGGYDSDQSPTRATASTITDDQLFNYYVPRYQQPTQTAATPQVAQQYQYGTPASPRAQRYSSQPNLYYSAYPAATAPPQVYAATPQQQQAPSQQYTPRRAKYSTPISAGYHPRLRQSPRYMAPTSPRQPRLYSYDDMDLQDHNQEQHPTPVAYLVMDQPPAAADPAYETGVDGATCPLCGGAGFHTHTEQEPSPRPSTPRVVYTLPEPVRRPRPRQRSQSASRVRHYSPEGRRRTRYLVRDYHSESESAESDDELYRRRSRSTGRRRHRPGRRYRKVTNSNPGNRSHGDLGDGVCTAVKTNPPNIDSDEGEYEDALNRSLNLTGEIDDLTTKMMGTVRDELKRAKKHKDSGSSVW